MRFSLIEQVLLFALIHWPVTLVAGLSVVALLFWYAFS